MINIRKEWASIHVIVKMNVYIVFLYCISVYCTHQLRTLPTLGSRGTNLHKDDPIQNIMGA